MRYIGSKVNLLEEINKEISRYKKTHKTFCDIFSGTGIVASYFKKDFEIISNDLMFFSYVIQRAKIQNNNKHNFNKLRNHINVNPFQFFLDHDTSKHQFKKLPFVLENFAPYKKNDRKYLSEINSKKIDFIRQTIDIWYENKLINEDEFYYLIACLVESIPFVSNIAGTYGAFLKHWDKRALKNIDVKDYDFILNNNKNNRSYNLNANELIKKISGDILYIDPPYNARQYSSNYHLLETIAKYDNPVLKGKTGIREDNKIISNYCKKNKIHETFDELIREARFKVIVVSYSNEGILTKNEISEILCRHADKKTLKIIEIPYRRYSRENKTNTSNLFEYIFRIEK